MSCADLVAFSFVLDVVLTHPANKQIHQHFGFHTFRHSAASLINAQTSNLKLAQRFLGHPQLNTTADIYTHTSEKAERETAAVLEKAILGDLFPVIPQIATGNKSRMIQ